MPIYDFSCPACYWQEKDLTMPIAEMELGVICPKCGGPMVQLLPAPRVQMDYGDYLCPVTGKLVSGRTQHRENLARQGCRVVEQGETAEYHKQREAQDREFGRQVSDTVDALWEGLSAQKKQEVVESVQAGMEATVVRR